MIESKALGLCGFVACILASHVALAKETVKFVTFPIPLMVENKDKGVFVDLAKEVARRAGFDAEVAVVPPPRAIGDFLEGKADALFPALDVNFPDTSKFFRSENIYEKKDFAFTKKGGAQLTSIADLAGKKVGITNGYPYVKELTENKSIRFQPTQTDEQNAEKLRDGRIDAFVVEEKSGLKAFEKTKSSDAIQYDPAKALSTQSVYYACKSKELADRISKALADMKSDGTFAKIMSAAN